MLRTDKVSPYIIWRRHQHIEYHLPMGIIS